MTVTPVDDPRVVLARHGLHAKKSWGQNFLVDPHAHEAIVGATVGAEDDWVIEIGAGLGTLTARLAAAVPRGRVVAVERDRDMAHVLRGELGGAANVELAEENALELDYGAIAARAGRPVVVAGNLPYQISSPLLFQILGARRHVRRAVLMLQKEVVDRLIARAGTREYGALTAMVALYADVRRVLRVSAGAFHPRPKVDSAVVALVPLAGGATRVELGGEPGEARYARVVHLAFGQRRKTLRNALRAGLDAEAVERALRATALDGGRRGETLSVEEFAALANALGADVAAQGAR